MTAAAATTEATPPPKKQRGFPSPLTILLIVILGVWLATLLLPSGEYQHDADGAPVPGSFTQVDSPMDFGERVTDLLLSPVNGLLGVQDLESGHVGPFNTGAMFGSVQVFMFILAIGGFMTVVFATGALDRGIAALAHRFSTRGPVLIVVLMVLFGLLGSLMTWSDESLGFYALLIPLLLSLGYDRMVVVAVVTVAPFVGSIGATISPFRIGIAADAAGVGIGDGIALRVLLFVLTMAAVILYTLRYAKRVKVDPSRSLTEPQPEDAELVAAATAATPERVSARDKVVITLLAGTFALLVFSIVPWGAILHNTVADPVTHETVTEAFSWELGWWLPELIAMFAVMSIVIGAVGKLGEAGTSSAFMRGCSDFLGPAILVAVARGVSVILTNTMTIDTVLNAMEGIVDGASSVGFVMLLSMVTLPLNFLVGSGSAGMALVMPILAPVGDFAGVDRSLVITTYNAIGAWFNLVLPTNAVLIAGIALGKVSIDRYFKFMLPLMGVLLAIILVVIGVAAAVG